MEEPSNTGNPPPLLRPQPRRPFQLPESSGSSTPNRPRSFVESAIKDEESTQLNLQIPNQSDGNEKDDKVTRSRSILNLTASTLFGIYAPTLDSADTSTPQTPWGTGAETPLHRHDSIGDELSPTLSRDPGSTYNPQRGQFVLNSEEIARRLSRTAASGAAEHTASNLSHLRRRSSGYSAVRDGRAGSGKRAYDGTQITYSRQSTLSIVLRNIILFSVGVSYGAVVARFHGSDHGRLASDGKGDAGRASGSADAQSNHLFAGLELKNLLYLLTWGLAGVALGNLLPWIDDKTQQRSFSRRRSQAQETNGDESKTRRRPSRSTPGEEEAAPDNSSWTNAIRGIGSFVGVAFAIRRLPWETTQQLSLTLSLANPLLWYLLDRTASGLALSSVVGGLGTLLLALSGNLALIPAPTLAARFHRQQYGASDVLGGWASNVSASVWGASSSSSSSSGGKAFGGGSANVGQEAWWAVAAWSASVLFCSAVCFGNLGRLLSR